MLRFLKRHRNSAKKLIPPENPTHQIADIDSERRSNSQNTNRRLGGGSRIANRDERIESQQLPAPDASTSTPTPGHEGGNAGLQGSAEERLGLDALGLHHPETVSNTRNQRERKDRGPGVKQHSEAAPELTLGGGQDDGDADDLVRPGRSRGKERGWVDRTLGRTALAIELAKGPAEAFGPLKAVLASISGVYAQYQNTVAVKEKIEILHSRIAKLEVVFEQPASDDKERKLREGLLMKFKDIEEQLQSLHGRSTLLRYLDNAQDNEDIGGLLEDLQEVVNNYMMVQQMAMYEQGCKLMDAAEKSVLNNFRCARGAEYRHGERKGCLKGTRGAVLSGIELWARDFGRSPVYWLNGLAGTGKSTIAKTIAERLFVDGRLGASFFCSRDFEDRRNLQLIFPTLATQLARKYTEFRSILVPLIQSDPEIAYESLYNQMEKLVAQPLNGSGISTVIVIDALDECEDEESASAILSVLGRLVPEIPRVKFFLTGRPEPRISEGFRLPLLAEMTDVFVLHAVEQDQVDSDIRLFFKTNFLELTDRRRGLDHWPTEEQLDRLCERAAGLFVYAAATVKFVDNSKWGPRNQLNTLLQSQKIGDREGRTLDSLYTSILQGAFGDDGPECDAKIRSVLGAVVLAMNPLSPSTIAVLLGSNVEDVPPLLSSVNSLLILPGDANQPVRPFHKSFPDFITNPTRCTNKRFYIFPPDHHPQLLIGCLDLMNKALEKNMCKLPDGVANSDISDLKERTERYIDPALQYACVSWHTHLNDADTIRAQALTITHTLHQFLETKFLFWLEVLSVLGTARNAVEALEVTTDWLEESLTLNLANDCFRFVIGYFNIISTSSPHIYHSALVVAPKDSIVRKLYESHAHPFIRLVYGAPMSWDPSSAAAARPSWFQSVVWSPCNRFIAITWNGTSVVEVLDSATLQRLQTFESFQDISTGYRALIFSPDGRILTCFDDDRAFPPDRELSVISWDLQTGGISSIIKWRGPAREPTGSPSITYSVNGKMVGISTCWSGRSEDTEIFICDVASGVLMHSHSLDDAVPLSNHIWTHGGSMRFATADATTITIWEVGFTSDAPLTEVETLPAPDGFDSKGPAYAKLHPAPCRLAFVSRDGITVWDVRNSRYLLECTGVEFCSKMAFSSDGRFFACSAAGSGTYLWKESPTGYILRGILPTGAEYPVPLLTQNGGSIVTFYDCAIQLWHTESSSTPLSSISARTPRRAKNFILEFHPDGMLAVVVRGRGSTITILDLKSGVPQLTIDTNMEVHGLGVIGNTVVAIGDRKAITWDLPAGDCVPSARVGPEGNSGTINFDDSQHDPLSSASISPDSRYIALYDAEFLRIYSTSTGELLWNETAFGHTTRFSPDGRELWHTDSNGEADVWRVDGGQKMLELLEHTVDTECPPDGYHWGSSRGYWVTDNWWILSPDGRRLLMLPPSWQSYVVDRVWKDQFLAFLHCSLSEPVILELDVNCNL